MYENSGNYNQWPPSGLPPNHPAAQWPPSHEDRGDSQLGTSSPHRWGGSDFPSQLGLGFMESASHLYTQSSHQYSTPQIGSANDGRNIPHSFDSFSTFDQTMRRSDVEQDASRLYGPNGYPQGGPAQTFEIDTDSAPQTWISGDFHHPNQVNAAPDVSRQRPRRAHRKSQLPESSVLIHRPRQQSMFPCCATCMCHGNATSKKLCEHKDEPDRTIACTPCSRSGRLCVSGKSTVYGQMKKAKKKGKDRGDENWLENYAKKEGLSVHPQGNDSTLGSPTIAKVDDGNGSHFPGGTMPGSHRTSVQQVIEPPPPAPDPDSDWISGPPPSALNEDDSSPHSLFPLSSHISAPSVWAYSQPDSNTAWNDPNVTTSPYGPRSWAPHLPRDQRQGQVTVSQWDAAPLTSVQTHDYTYPNQAQSYNKLGTPFYPVPRPYSNPGPSQKSGFTELYPNANWTEGSMHYEQVAEHPPDRRFTGKTGYSDV